MLKVLIVEDESMFREYVKQVLDWNEIGFLIVGEAKNGKIALEIIKKTCVDLALVDISMPVMDGICFCKEAKQINPKLEILLLTGHNKFEYAKNALKIGVSDYILKPFDKLELETAVLNCKNKIINQRKNEDKNAKNAKAAKEVYANGLISDNQEIMEQEIKELIEQVIGNRTIRWKQLIIIEEDFFDQLWICHGQRNLWRSTVINILEEILPETVPYLLFSGNSGYVICLLLFEDQSSINTYEYNVFNQLCRIAKEKLKFSVTCAISEVFELISQVPYIYDQTLIMLHKKFMIGCGSVISKQDKIDITTRYYPKLNSTTIQNCLIKGKGDELEEYISNMFDELKYKNTDMELVCVFYMELISICLSFLSERGFDISIIFGNTFVPFTELKNLRSIEEAKRHALFICYQVIDKIGNRSYTRPNKIAKEAKKYIDSKYGDKQLSVENVARNLYINSSYLRAVFKKEYGITVSNYIFSIRMDHSKKLIPKGNVKLSEISDMVGFKDPAYFSKCFKKHYGISPSEYANIKN